MRTSGLVEVGAFRINNLRRSAVLEFYPWTGVDCMLSAISEQTAKPKKRDGMIL